MPDYPDPTAVEQLFAHGITRQVLLVKEVLVISGLHQLNKAQGDGLIFNPVQEVRQLVGIVATHQYGVHFEARSCPAGNPFVDTVQDFLQAVMAGDGLEASGVQAVNADVDSVHSSFQPGLNSLIHPVTIGGHGDGLNTGNLFNRRYNVVKFTAQGRLTTGNTHFFYTQPGESTN